ncbi:sugar transferase [Desulfococcaceae bacterium HSG9]|nr:sugar transferase [Desulfococcaceae bacterium HSG9]
MYKTRYKERIAISIIKFIDIFLFLCIFFYTREYIVFGHQINFNTLDRISIKFSLWHIGALLILSILWYIIFKYLKMYDFRYYETRLHRIIRIMTAASLGVAAAVFGAELIGMGGLDKKFPQYFWLITVALFLVYRLTILLSLRYIRLKKRNIRQIVIVGFNSRAIEIKEELSHPALGFNILGFIDDIDPELFQNINFNGKSKQLLLGQFSQFNDYISEHRLDEVLIALPLRTHYKKIKAMIQNCTEQGIKVRLICDLVVDLPRAITQIDKIEWSGTSIHFINYDVDRSSEKQQDLKRIIDLILAGIAVILLLPVFLIVALAIFIDDGWPVFFTQTRVGMNKKRYNMLKFRTMVRDADKMQAELEGLNEVEGAAFKITNDPRITRSGNFLRKTSLDEIPQFLNVIGGSMSLVGPRPLPVRDFEKFYDNSHRRRFSVKPGITGLWQISDRDSISFKEWMQLDLDYIDTRNWLVDIKILLKTIPAVIRGKGAK